MRKSVGRSGGHAPRIASMPETCLRVRCPGNGRRWTAVKNAVRSSAAAIDDLRDGGGANSSWPEPAALGRIAVDIRFPRAIGSKQTILSSAKAYA